ncbi:DNA polymerase III subunit delta [Candidatus Saccharibacteria bacterium]|jgi:DNA polymerase-3 subunit delta|nr:DNA polymerase III subunit delta [Candidatus Saccharibacteria bacterium]HOR23083.1 DNA polymerase III subunit delta [Candidatus Saccharibacteria bacterium]HPW47775.1 DNA polymerase III subunit delta [Candidatus Saccharibacteria bacterium]
MITAFIGDNYPARETALKEFVGNFSTIHGAAAIDRLSGDSIELNLLKDSVATIPFLSSKRMVIVRGLGQNKEISDNFDDLVRYVADTTEFVVVENHLDSRSRFLTELKKYAEIKEFKHLEGEDLVDWVIEQVNQLGGSINRALANLLVDRVGDNHQMLANELEKLVLYDSKITKESIMELTSLNPQSSVFAMLDSTFNNQPARAIKLYKEQREQGLEPGYLLGMISWQLYVLAVVKSANGLSVDRIAKESKMNPFVIRKNLNIARRILNVKLRKMLDDTIEADRLIKQRSTNADDVLKTLILSFK